MTDLPELTHVIAGRPDDDAGPTLPVFDPSTGTTVADIPNASAETVDAAVAAATAALAAWSELTPSQRAGRMMDLADCLEENLDRIVELETLDCGKPLQNAREESKFAIDLIRFCAGAGRCMEGKAAQEYAAGKTSFVRREPLGVVAGITPWNYPVVMLAYKLAPALAAGNTLVVKPAEQTPLSTAFIAARAQETLPAGVSTSCSATARRLAPRWCGIPMLLLSPSPARRRPESWLHARPPRRSSASCWNWGASHRLWCSTTPTWTSPHEESPTGRSTTRVRTARLLRGCWPRPASTTRWWID